MKKPIFTEAQRREWIYPELEVAKLKFKREFMKTRLAKAMIKFIEWLNNHLK